VPSLEADDDITGFSDGCGACRNGPRASPGAWVSLVPGQRVRVTLSWSLQHFNAGRPHPALGHLTPAQADACPAEPINLANHLIRRKQVLGGLTHEYYVAALPTCAATGKEVTRRIVFPNPAG